MKVGDIVRYAHGMKDLGVIIEINHEKKIESSVRSIYGPQVKFPYKVYWFESDEPDDWMSAAGLVRQI